MDCRALLRKVRNDAVLVDFYKNSPKRGLTVLTNSIYFGGAFVSVVSVSVDFEIQFSITSSRGHSPNSQLSYLQ
jgi:hypothetical protein